MAANHIEAQKNHQGLFYLLIMQAILHHILEFVRK